MKKSIRTIAMLFAFSMMTTALSAQYGPQFINSGFEEWTSRETDAVSEPVHWHSGGTATGTWSGFLSNQVEQSAQTRPGSTGSRSARLFPTSVMGVTANGSLTNGRMNAGSMTATGSDNYNYTQRSESAFSTPIGQLPDSLTVWVCFRSNSAADKAQVKAVVHGDADYKLKADGTEEPADKHVATAALSFTRTSTANGAYTWRRLSVPFVNNGPCTDVRYILFTATTNETPGTGSTSDDLFIDDVLLVYRPSFNLYPLADNTFDAGDDITLQFALGGTMSPDNLNAPANEVIAQLSDTSGSFSNYVELGRITTDHSGSITAQIPAVATGYYKVRLVSTNYPMVAGNIQEIAIGDVTGLSESLASCTVYPNPFRSVVNVETGREAQGIRVYDVYGRLLKQEIVSAKRFEIDLEGLSAGVYLMQVEYGDSRSFYRIVKAE